MPGRSYSSNSYKYGFNGQEKDDEISGTGNSYDTHYRAYDARLGRWFSNDPITFPYESPYAGISNNPIVFNDPLGDKIKYGTKEDKRNVRYLRKHDAEFKKDWDSKTAKYKGKNSESDLLVSHTKNDSEVRNDLKHSDIEDVRPSDGKEVVGNDNDYLQYNGKLDSRDVEVTKYQEQVHSTGDLAGNPYDPVTHNFSFSLKSNINDFTNWEFNLIPKYSKGSVGGTFIQKTNSNTMFNGTVTISPLKGADGLYRADAGGATYVFRAMSKPKLYNESFTRNGWGYRRPISFSSENPIKLKEKE